jgi:hypothetical protein
MAAILHIKRNAVNIQVRPGRTPLFRQGGSGSPRQTSFGSIFVIGFVRGKPDVPQPLFDDRTPSS